MEKNLQALIQFAMISMVVLFIISRLILQLFKLKEKDKHNKYDVFASTMTDIALCSMFIGMFASMILEDRSSDTNGVTVMMAMWGVIPYSLFVSFACGYKRLKYVWMSVINLVICYGGFIAITWLA